MQIKNKLISTTIFFLLLTIYFTGCFDNINVFGTSYSEKESKILEYEGFPIIYLDFESNGKIYIKSYDSDSNLIDSEFFYGNDIARINIGSFKETLSDEKITIKIMDKSNSEISKKIINLKGPNVDIISSTEYVWSNQGKTSLIEINAYVYNIGDVPVFPDKIKIKYNDQVYSSFLIPTKINPDSYEEISSMIYIEDIEKNDNFIIEIYDTNNNLLVEKNFIFDNLIEVDTAIYRKGVDNTLEVPVPSNLWNYYLDHERYYIEDYTAFIFDKYDDSYMDLFLDLLIENLDFSNLFNLYSDEEKINEIGDFIQQLNYSIDYEEDLETEYPRFPVETLFNENCNGGGDCEDKAILGASLLIDDDLSYNVSLIRIPNHMVVGVNLPRDAISKYDYYVDEYYFLDTSPGPEDKSNLGYVHKDYQNQNDIRIFALNSKPIIDHYWENGSLTIYTENNRNKILKINCYISNLGDKKAENLKLKGVFYTNLNLQVDEEIIEIEDIEPYDKIKKTFSFQVPKDIECIFDTRVYLNDVKVHEQSTNGTIS